MFNCACILGCGSMLRFIAFSSSPPSPGSHLPPSGEPVVPEGSTLRASRPQATGWAQDPAEPIKMLPWRQKGAGFLGGAGTAMSRHIAGNNGLALHEAEMQGR